MSAEANRVAIGLRRIRYQRVFAPEAPLGFESLERAFDPRFHRHFWERALLGGLLPPGTASALLTALQRVDPSFAGATQELLEEEVPGDLQLSGDALQAAAQEADSVRLAADIARIPRAELSAPAPDGERGFLERLGAVRVPESTAIAYDAMRFLDFERLDHPSVVVDFRRGRERLVVINVNTQPLESWTGADLIYVNQSLDSVVLVQYKTMRREGAGPEAEARYRPDARLAGQLEQMRAIESPASDGSPGEYRLHPGWGYVKLCSPVSTLRVLPNQLVSGMYIPLDHWESLAASPQLQGPRGGTAFSYRTVGRHISNELFVLLVRGAWIGTRGLASLDLSQQVPSALDAGRSVTVATHSVSPS